MITVQLCVATPGAYLHTTGKTTTLYIVKPSGMTLIATRHRDAIIGKVVYEIKPKRSIPLNRRANRINKDDAAELLSKWTAGVTRAISFLQQDITTLHSQA